MLNAKEERQRLTLVIKDSKARQDIEIKRYKSAIQNLRVAIREYDSAYTAYVAKQNDKLKAKLDTAVEKLETAYSIVADLRERIATLGDIISRHTASIIDLVGAESGQGKAEAKNLDKYTASIEKRMSAIEGAILETLPEMLKSSDAPEAVTAMAYDEPAVSAPAAPVNVNVAPVDIDITPMVERAVTAAIERLSAGLNEKLDGFVASLAIPAPIVPVSVASDHTNSELEAHLVEGEAELYEKLSAMCVTIDELIAGIAEASGTYLTLAQKLKEISDTQRQVNDMQRQTARDQQGVSVAQRLIADTQLEIVTEQKMIGDKQEELSKLVAALTESQSAVLANETAIAESQAAIESSVKELLERERTIVAAQQAITDTAAKVEAAQRTVQEKQAELLLTQRETMAQQRQVQRGQRSVTEKQSEAGKTPRRSKKKTDDTDPATVVALTDSPDDTAAPEATPTDTEA